MTLDRTVDKTPALHPPGTTYADHNHCHPYGGKKHGNQRAGEPHTVSRTDPVLPRMLLPIEDTCHTMTGSLHLVFSGLTDGSILSADH
ncbi:hypothetical protein D3C74_391600 [compost metagenome]